MSCQHPGKVLFDLYMQPNQLSQNKLAKALGVPPRRINEIIHGKRCITADTAVRLSKCFSNSASYWMHIQAEYDIVVAEDKIGQRLHMIQALHGNEALSTQNKPARSENKKTIRSGEPHGTRIKRHLMR